MIDDSFRITDLNKTNEEKWDKIVHNHIHSNIFQTPEMTEVYKQTKNYEPISLAVMDDTDEIVATLQAVVMKEMSGILGSFSARSLIQGGPLFVEDEKGIKALKVLMECYDKIAQRKALYTEIRNMWDTSKISNFLNKIGYKPEDHLNLLIDLRKTKDELWSSLTKSRRRGVRSAKKRDLKVEVVEDKSQVSFFYKILQENYRQKGLLKADISLFNAVYDILVPINMAQFFLVKYGDDYIGGRVVLLFNKTAYAWYRSAKPEFLKLYPNDLMGWDTIERYHDEGFHWLDLGGAGKPNEQYGVRDFKSQFGGDFVNHGRYKQIYSPLEMKIIEKGFQVYRKIVFPERTYK